MSFTSSGSFHDFSLDSQVQSGVETGSGGNELSIYSGGTVTDSDFPSGTAVAPSNGSSYTFEFAFLSSDELFNFIGEDAPNDVKSGDTGGDIRFWSKDSEIQLDDLSKTTYEYYLNESSFPLPRGFTSYRKSSYGIGSLLEIDITDTQKAPVTGNLSVYIGTEIISSSEVGGVSVVSLPAPPYILDGENTNQGLYEYSLEFSPLDDSIPIRREGLSGSNSISESYKNVVGLVESNDNTPLSNETVATEGDNVVTGENGEFNILSPVGIETELRSLSGSYSEIISVQEQTEGEYDITFKYPGLRLSASLEDGSPIEGATVTYAGKSEETDEGGSVKDNRLPLGSYTITIFQYYEADVSILEQGQTVRLEFAPGSRDFVDPLTGEIVDEFTSLTVKATDESTGSRVSNVDIGVSGISVNESTGLNGEGTMVIPPSIIAGNPVGSTYLANVAEEDDRYSKRVVEGTVGSGEDVVEVELQREAHISQL